MTLSLRVLAAALVVASVLGCDRGPVSTMPEPLTLQGVWQGTAEIEYEGEVRTGTYVLTLTPSRFINTFFVYVGTTRFLWKEWGSWSADETVLTMTTSTARTTTVPYQWGDENRQEVTLDAWSEDPISAEVAFKRSAPLTVGDIAGNWSAARSLEDDPNTTGDLVRWARRYTLRSDGTITYRNERFYDNIPMTFTQYEGTYTFDPDEIVVLMTVESVERTSAHDGVEVGHVLRTAFAPSGDENLLYFSDHYSEQMLDEESMTWVDNVDNPHGDYRYWLDRR